MAIRTRLLSAFLLWIVTGIILHVSAIDRMELYELRRHFVHGSSLSNEYPCTEREAECLKESKLLYEGDGQCYTVREQGPCSAGEVFHADKAEAERLGGHLHGSCVNSCERVLEAPLAATGECMTRSEVASKICRSELYLEPARDVFGQWVCEWTRIPCSLPNYTRPSFPGELLSPGICSIPADVLRSKSINLSSNETADDHPLLQFFSDVSYKEREFLCSEAEKECLQYGRLLHMDGTCHRTGEWGQLCGPGRSFRLDKGETQKENGHLRGTCVDMCDSHSKEILTNCISFNGMLQICRHDWGMNPGIDVFGQIVCYCLSDRQIALTVLESISSQPQPVSKPGSCRVPHFPKPFQLPRWDETLTLGFEGPCSEEEFACLQKGLVLFDGACHALRTHEPCAEGEELVLDKEAMAHARLQPKCAPTPCPEGSVVMPIDGVCRTIEKAKSLLCLHHEVALDEFGGWQCNYNADWPADLTSIVRHTSNGTCELPKKNGSLGALGFALGLGLGLGGKTGGPPRNGGLKGNPISGVDIISPGVNEIGPGR